MKTCFLILFSFLAAVYSNFVILNKPEQLLYDQLLSLSDEKTLDQLNFDIIKVYEDYPKQKPVYSPHDLDDAAKTWSQIIVRYSRDSLNPLKLSLVDRYITETKSISQRSNIVVRTNGNSQGEFNTPGNDVIPPKVVKPRRSRRLKDKNKISLAQEGTTGDIFSVDSLTNELGSIQLTQPNKIGIDVNLEINDEINPNNEKLLENSNFSQNNNKRNFATKIKKTGKTEIDEDAGGLVLDDIDEDVDMEDTSTQFSIISRHDTGNTRSNKGNTRSSGKGNTPGIGKGTTPGNGKVGKGSGSYEHDTDYKPVEDDPDIELLSKPKIKKIQKNPNKNNVSYNKNIQKNMNRQNTTQFRNTRPKKRKLLVLDTNNNNTYQQRKDTHVRLRQEGHDQRNLVSQQNGNNIIQEGINTHQHRTDNNFGSQRIHGNAPISRGTGYHNNNNNNNIYQQQQQHIGTQHGNKHSQRTKPRVDRSNNYKNDKNSIYQLPVSNTNLIMNGREKMEKNNKKKNIKNSNLIGNGNGNLGEPAYYIKKGDSMYPVYDQPRTALGTDPVWMEDKGMYRPRRHDDDSPDKKTNDKHTDDRDMNSNNNNDYDRDRDDGYGQSLGNSGAFYNGDYDLGNSNKSSSDNETVNFSKGGYDRETDVQRTKRVNKDFQRLGITRSSQDNIVGYNFYPPILPPIFYSPILSRPRQHKNFKTHRRRPVRLPILFIFGMIFIINTLKVIIKPHRLFIIPLKFIFLDITIHPYPP